MQIMVWGMIPLLLAAFCACSRENVAAEETTGIPIRFGVSIASEGTKAGEDLPYAPTKKDYLVKDGNVVHVFATWENEGVFTDIFRGREVALTCKDHGGGDFTWEYSPLQYWRQGGKYHFTAVYPDVHTEQGSNGQRLVTTYSMLDDDFDLLMANGKRDNSHGEDNTTKMQLEFKHACAAVRVIFSKGTDDPNRHYTLDSFEMENIHAVGVLVGENAQATWSVTEFRYPSVWSWQAQEEKRIDVPKSFERMEEGDDPGFLDLPLADYNWTRWHFAIPQDLNQSDGLVPAIRYGVYVRQYDTTGAVLLYETADPIYTTIPLPLTYANGDPVEWVAGKMYTYKVVIQKGNDFITLSVDDWDRYDVHVDDVNFSEKD